MSGSETGVMTGREPFGLQSNPVTSQPMLQNMRLAFSADGAAVYQSVNPSSPPYQPNNTVTTGSAAAPLPSGAGDMAGPANPGFNMNMGSEPTKRRRGRPRKYGPDGGMGLALVPGGQAFAPVAQPADGGGLSSLRPYGSTSRGSSSPTSFKKARGRPRGSGKKRQLEALGSTGLGFTPHVITVKAGEDVSAKIMAFSQHGPRTICILSANGAISNVTLRQPATCGGTVTYEGRFEILSLSGSFMLSEICGQRSRTGGLSVSLSGPDGRVLGGGVVGLLTAAAPVQVIVGSFIADGRKESKAANQNEPLSAPPKFNMVQGPPGSGSPPSRGTLSESSGGPGSPLNQSTGVCNNSNISILPWK